MIHIDHSRVPPPPEFEKWRARGLDRVREHLDAATSKRAQKRAPVLSFEGDELDLTEAVVELCRGKCAYCEIAIEVTPIVDRFRPASRASSLEGEISPDHYSWLAYDWDNLLLICSVCYRHKRSLFPVERRRAEPWATGGALDAERPLLADPRQEDVTSHFLFEIDGSVRGLTKRGKTTIDLLRLNRPELVTARNRAAAQVEDAFRSRPLGTERQRTAALKAAAAENSPDLPYAAVREAQFNLLALEMAEWDVSSTKRAQGAGATPPTWAEDYGATVWLERVEIENFRIIHEMELKFPEPTTTASGLKEPWIMMLGENGVGKSSVLKAIALAMAPPAKRHRLAPNAGSLFNRRVSRGTGAIRLFFSGSPEPLELLFDKRSQDFTVAGQRPRLPLLAYGSTRLLPPRRKTTTPPQPRRVRISNLFDPRYPLANAEQWLADTESVPSRQFNLLATSLKTLLSLGEDDRITRRSGGLRARLDGASVAIDEFSDGYQSLFALATDMMLHLSRASFDMDTVAGLVLLDEIEVHLHPQWKIEVVDTLRSLFPHVRFISTTHDPLCLHGLESGEVHVLERTPTDSRIEMRQVDVPPGVRADQLLTGAWFGLTSTRDEETLELMRRHGALLAKETLDAPERDERRDLEEKLNLRLHGFDSMELRQESLARASTDAVRPRTKAQKQALRAKIMGGAS